MIIRNTEQKDLPKVLAIYAYARKFMRENGNPDQWKDSFPEKEIIEADVINKTGYVIVDDANEIVGVFAFIEGEDPTYKYIENGSWLNDEPYGTIHRIASSGKIKEILEQALAFASAKVKNIRIDTHADNKVMQHKLIKNGFSYCGIIFIADGSARYAYQKIA